MSPDPERPAVPGRTERKRRAILEAATSLFLLGGFRGTSMDEIAALAQVSKQTLYKQFGDKEGLFREIVEGITGRSEALAAALAQGFGPGAVTAEEQLEARLLRVGRVLLDGVLQPNVLSLRRLIIAEAEQFPDLALAYYEQAPARGLEAIAEGLGPALGSGLLRAEDPRLAAAHFAYLVLSPAQDRALFVPAESPGEAQRERIVRAGVRAFLGAYAAR